MKLNWRPRIESTQLQTPDVSQGSQEQKRKDAVFRNSAACGHRVWPAPLVLAVPSSLLFHPSLQCHPFNSFILVSPLSLRDTTSPSLEDALFPTGFLLGTQPPWLIRLKHTYRNLNLYLISHIRENMIFFFGGLSYFTHDDFFSSFIHLSENSLTYLNNRIISHYVNVPHFHFSFISWLAFRLLPISGYLWIKQQWT